MSHSRTPTLICVLVLQCILCKAANAGGPAPVVGRVERMEMCIFAEKHSREKLPSRVAELEKSIFGKPNAGALTGRVEKLEAVIGNKYSQFIPTEAPRVDARAQASSLETDGMPKLAPSISETLRRKQSNRAAIGSQPLAGFATSYGAQTTGGPQRYGAFTSTVPVNQQAPINGNADDPRWQAAGNELARSASRAAVSTALNGGRFNAGTVLNAVHCPLCKLLSP